MNGTAKPRLVVYGLGQFGQMIVRFAAQKGWPIVAAFNRAGPKVGQDVGRLAGLDRDLGVFVQDCETARYDALAADVAIVAVSNRLVENLPAYRRLLGARVNVICHGAEAYFPRGSDPATAEAIDALAKQNGVTFTGGGIWDVSRIWAGITVAGPCTEIHAMRHTSITDAQRIGLPAMLQVGVGMTPPAYTAAMVKAAGAVGGMYKTIPEQVMTALGYRVTKTSERREPVLFDAPIHCALLDRTLEPGTVVGTRIIAEVETAQGVPASAHIELRLFRPDEVEHMAWSVEGKPASRIRVERDDSGHASAACMFNRVRDVMAARPGIVTVSELGPMKHTALE